MQPLNPNFVSGVFMSKSDMWENRVSEIDSILQANEEFEIDEPNRRTRHPSGRNQPQQQQREEIYPQREEAAFKLNRDDRDAVRSVTLRLEQARIYEELIKTDLFSGYEGDQKAIDNVKSELKDFLVERLKVLMGIGQEKKKVQIDYENLSFDLPFNEVEIEFLKALALQGTKGQSAGATTATVTAKPIQSDKSRNSIRGLSKSEKPKINPIKRSAPKQEYIEPEPEYEEEYEEEEPNFPPPRQEKTRREEYKEPVRRKSSKKVSDMSDDDIVRRSEEIDREQREKRSGRPANALPQPNESQMNNMYANRQNSQPGIMNLISTVIANKK
jgi:hypothetical protein